MATRIPNIPSPDILITSLRSMGYSFKAAIADIIDNSISAEANNIYVNFSTNNNEEQYVSILDDGFGMNDEELFNAMKYGSFREFYGEKDLGRFGLGLKSASLSQCRVLTVLSKKENSINAYRWDIDDVIETKEWQCLKLDRNEYSILPNFTDLEKLNTGTLVIWQNFDVINKRSEGGVSYYLSDEMDNADKHIRLVFHRFLNEKNGLCIYINNLKLTGFDPFLEDIQKNVKTDVKPIRELGDGVIMQAYILPHQTDLSDDDIEALGGIEAVKEQQGFFIYRNNRLIVNSTWFNLTSRSVNPELYKYGRIKVDIPNTMDDMWEIDIKKQNAIPPRRIVNMLRKAVSTVCDRSKDKTTRRARLEFDINENQIWSKKVTRDGKDLFFINPQCKFIENYLDEFDDCQKAKILRLLDVLSSSVPSDDIYNSVCNKKMDKELDDEKINSIVLIAVEQYKNIRRIRQCDTKTAFEAATSYEPFDSEEIKKLVWRLIENEQ